MSMWGGVRACALPCCAWILEVHCRCCRNSSEHRVCVSIVYLGESRVQSMTLDPIRCTLCVKSAYTRVVASGQNQIFPLRGYIAETYAKVMGVRLPSQPSLKPECTLSFC